MNRLFLVLSIGAPLAIGSIQEPVAVDGGLVASTPSPQWTPGMRVFRGIPYAAPPVGSLRWKPPQPVATWTGVKAADRFSPVCMQPPTALGGNAWRDGLVPMSEDCLYLNVWTHAKNAGEHLPVMVFVHGGGNTRGAASENQYDGDYLAKKGVVFVSFNYRMNVFGFLAHPDLTRESDHHASGNYALMDQMAALQWVQRNIAKFGGDPNRVMIFGHSAGASNVCSLMASPLAKGLFHRVLAQSGSCISSRVTLAEAESRGLALAATQGAHSIAELRAKSAQEILAAPRGLMGPIVDGYVLPRDPYSIFATGKQNDVPLIVGSTADDGPGAGPPLTAAEMPVFARQTYGDLEEKYLKTYPSTDDTQAKVAAHDLRRDRTIWGAKAWADVQAATGKSKVYWYLFSHVSPLPASEIWDGKAAPEWGAYHGSEIVYVFNAFPLQDWQWRDVDLKVGDLVSSMWTNFAKTGNPNGAGLPEWPAYDARNKMQLNLSDHPNAQPCPYKAGMDFLDEYSAAQGHSH
jgi:para-nitrobenzyl esterase